jgi:uncharacterized DUF497 family protein
MGSISRRHRPSEKTPPRSNPARLTDEPRSLVIGTIGGKHWSAVITYRGDNIRVISVRRSKNEEVTIYESLGI